MATGTAAMNVMRYDVWPIELMELYEGAEHQEECEIVVMASAYDAAIQARDRRIGELSEALLTSPCPRPIEHDDGTVADCIKHGHCGCDNSDALTAQRGT